MPSPERGNSAPETGDWRLSLLPLPEASPIHRALFSGATRAEGGWPWFLLLAATTLDAGEEAVMAVLAEPGGEPKAALPLVRMVSGQFRALTAPYSCLFCPPLGTHASAMALGALLRPLVGRSLRLDCLDPEDNTVQGLLEGLKAGGFAVDRYRHFPNWFEDVSSFAQYWERRGSRLKETVRRKFRRYDRAGRLSFMCLTTAEEIAAAAPIYQEIYALSWKVPEPHAGFIPALLEKFSGDGSVRLGVMRLDGAPIAVQIWLVAQGRATIFKLAHLDDQAAVSPGTLLTWWLLKTIVDQEGVREIDLGRGDDAYKRDWLSDCRERIGVVACNPRTMLGVADFVRLSLPTRIKLSLS